MAADDDGRNGSASGEVNLRGSTGCDGHGPQLEAASLRRARLTRRRMRAADRASGRRPADGQPRAPHGDAAGAVRDLRRGRRPSCHRGASSWECARARPRAVAGPTAPDGGSSHGASHGPAMWRSRCTVGRSEGSGRRRGRRKHPEPPSAARPSSPDADPDLSPAPRRLPTVAEENHIGVIRLSAARDTHLSTGFSPCGSAGGRHSDKESSGTTSGSGFPTGFPLGAGAPRG